MVLSRLFSRRDKEESFEIDNPNDGGYEDCLSCRVLGTMCSNLNFQSLWLTLVPQGSTALVSLGGYTYYNGMKNLKLQKKAIEMSKSKYKYGSRQFGILTLSATLVGMGLYRTFN